jgi:hypothetical protein
MSKCKRNSVKLFREHGSGCVRVPDLRAFIVFSNTIALDPLVVFVYIQLTLIFVFRWSRVVGRWGWSRSGSWSVGGELL